MKVLSIIGARPQFIKEAIIQKEIKKTEEIQEILLHTGQHYDYNMFDIFFDKLTIKVPEYNLGIKGSTHGEMTGKMLIEIEKVMISEKPDLVLLYGDTNSTLAAAIAASKLKIKIAHIEAGLRRNIDITPEEINRRITDRISDYLFVSSELSKENLLREGKKTGIYVAGDVMYDLYLRMKPNFNKNIVENLNLKKNNYIVMTLHRDFNVDSIKILESILKNVNNLSKEILVVFPLHPRTKKRIEQFGLQKYTSNIKIIEPLDYLSLMALTESCYKVITDSGGYQKEAYFAKKQAIVLMRETTWKELVNKGYNVLSSPGEIYYNIMKENSVKFEEKIYGDGLAAKKIIKTLLELM